MTRIKNADEFLLELRRIRAAYNETFAPQLQKLRDGLVGAPPAAQAKVDQDLEAHIRVYTVNAILAALNWRMDVTAGDMGPNLVPEVALKSLERGTRRFLDYLGIERQTDVPLLAVETKRPSAELPRLRDPSAVYGEVNPSVVVSQGLSGTALAREWNEWLDTLRDYVRSVQQAQGKTPLRVVITNGDWLIIFLDPADAFLVGGTKNPARIAVFSGSGGGAPDGQPEMERRYGEVFEHLEYHKVAGKAPPMSIGTLAFNVEGKNVERVMHGLRLRYSSSPTNFGESPSIWVSPVIFIRSRFGAWLMLDSGADFMIPHAQADLPVHLGAVDAAARDLLAQVNIRLGGALAATDLAAHFGDAAAFSALKAVREVSEDTFLLATGTHTHYLLGAPTVPDCPFHDATAAVANGAGLAVPILARSVKPRSFFLSAEVHHCAHREVHAAKASQITPENRPQCGSRSGDDNQAFCEIWRVDEFLCCRTCVFEPVCTKAAAFHLPCHPP